MPLLRRQLPMKPVDRLRVLFGRNPVIEMGVPDDGVPWALDIFLDHPQQQPSTLTDQEKEVLEQVAINLDEIAAHLKAKRLTGGAATLRKQARYVRDVVNGKWVGNAEKV